jgi:benzoylformate decarboxylase
MGPFFLLRRNWSDTFFHVLVEPWLTNVEATMLPRPWVKWAYEPVRAQDIPAVFMRAVATALQPPAGPVFLALPLGDWEQPCESPAVVRTVSQRIAPDPSRLAEFAKVLSAAQSPVLIYGSGIARGNGWDQAVAFAEALGAPVWAAPASERAPFPENHPLYSGGLPFAMGPLSKKLEGHDVALVVGAPVFRYYPYASGILGWNLPASVGIALAERDSGRNRPVIAVIGDGSFQYSVQSLWTGAQLR